MARASGGVHISARELNLVVLRTIKGELRAVAARRITLEPDQRDKPGAALKAALRELKKIAPEKLRFCIPKEQAILQHTVLPSTDPAEVADMARFEAERHIPFNADRHSVGFHIIRPTDSGGTEVVVGAADKPVIDRALGTAVDAGVEPVGLNVSSLAIFNAFLHEHPEAAASRNVATISIGVGHTDFVFSTGGRILFARSVNRGLAALVREWHSNHLDSDAPLDDQRIATACKMLDMMNLESHPGEDALPGAGPALGNAPGPRPAESARKWITDLLLELQRSYDYARREMNCPPIDLVALTGEGAVIRGMDRYLVANLNLETVVINPVARIGGDDQRGLLFGGLEMIEAFGVAIQPALKDAYALDLLPEAYYRDSRTRTLSRRVTVTAALAAVTLGLCGYAFYDRQTKQQRLAGEYQLQIDTMAPQVAQLREEKKKLFILKTYLEDPSSAVAVLDRVAGYPGTPERITYTQFQFTHGIEFLVEGHAADITDITNLREYLRRTPLFDDAIILEQAGPRRVLMNRPDLYTFRIQCTIPEHVPEPTGRSSPRLLGDDPDPLAGTDMATEDAKSTETLAAEAAAAEAAAAEARRAALRERIGRND